jgi:hypothetical protein
LWQENDAAGAAVLPVHANSAWLVVLLIRNATMAKIRIGESISNKYFVQIYDVYY